MNATSSFSILPLIEKKKKCEDLTREEIQDWIEALVQDRVPDYQTAALLMAIRLQGMSFQETLALTQAMVDSGDRLTFPGYELLADKHSTGGVGDKVTLILAPLLAACGLPVTMLSGRGLGFSGGTIDKFESLAGVTCDVSAAKMRAMLKEVGWANAQASNRLVPADRILYALRDVTGTVDSIPLITASILSKKIAGGAHHLCLDVKCGASAFMETPEQALALAKNLQTIGNMSGMEVYGHVTRMEEPLGRAIGNYLEMVEAVLYLKERQHSPLMDLVLALGTSMLCQAGFAENRAAAEAAMIKAIGNGKGLEKFCAYLEFNGAEPTALKKLLDTRFEDLPRHPILAPQTGYLNGIDGRALGEWLVGLGAGRATQEDRIDPLAGLVLACHYGEPVKAGAPIAWLYGAQASQRRADFEKIVPDLFSIQDHRPPNHGIVMESF